jgi:O-antigen/teichoic acid export membrane protein
MEEQLTISSVKKRAVKSVKWTFLMEVVGRGTQPIITLILARLLTPADFGLIGMCMVVISLTLVFQNFGLDRALIQREEGISEAANVAFWANLLLSVVLYLILFLSAPLIATFFREPQAVDVLRVLCLRIILFSLVSVQQALFQRVLEFKKLFVVRLISAVIPAFVSIPLALNHYGVWALVYGSLAGSLAQAVLLFVLTPWRPRLFFDYLIARQLVSFGGWAMLETLLGWLLLWGDSAILGRFLGAKELGVYRVGITLILLVTGFTCGAISTVTYSAFSRLQMNRSELKRYFINTTKLTAGIALPIGICLAFLSQPISDVVFGEKWQGIGTVIAIIGLSEAIAWLVGINPNVYRAMGKPDINSKLLILNVLYFIPAYILAAPYGLVAVCATRLLCTILSIPLHLYATQRILSISPLYLWQCTRAPIAVALVMGAVIYGTVRFSCLLLDRGWIQFILTAFFSAVFYVVAIWIIDREYLKRTYLLIRESLS